MKIRLVLHGEGQGGGNMAKNDLTSRWDIIGTYVPKIARNHISIVHAPLHAGIQGSKPS